MSRTHIIVAAVVSTLSLGSGTLAAQVHIRQSATEAPAPQDYSRIVEQHIRTPAPNAPAIAGGLSAAQGDHPMSRSPNIVLVHGAWADGSSWSGVIQRLQKAGYHVAAVQLG